MNNDILLWWWRWQNWREQLAIKLAWRLPKRVVYWAFVRMATHDAGNENPAEDTIMDVLKRNADWAR